MDDVKLEKVEDADSNDEHDQKNFIQNEMVDTIDTYVDPLTSNSSYLEEKHQHQEELDVPKQEFKKTCRVCMKSDSHLFYSFFAKFHGEYLAEIFKYCTSIEVCEIIFDLLKVFS